jgi:hypothetical protein
MKNLSILFFLFLNITVIRSQELVPYYKNGKYGYADKNMNIVIPCNFDDALPFYEGRALVVNYKDSDRNEFFIDSIGNKVFEITSILSNDYSAKRFTNGVCITNDNGSLVFLDKNGNGKVDNGKELFGPATGNRMQELSQYDDDKNGWIDENDKVFAKLAIWTKDANQQDQLKSLLEYNIGALYTGSINTAFQHNASNGEVLGEVTKLGAFIRQDGSAGLIQQVDFMA